MWDGYNYFDTENFRIEIGKILDRLRADTADISKEFPLRELKNQLTGGSLSALSSHWRSQGIVRSGTRLRGKKSTMLHDEGHVLWEKEEWRLIRNKEENRFQELLKDMQNLALEPLTNIVLNAEDDYLSDKSLKLICIFEGGSSVDLLIDFLQNVEVNHHRKMSVVEEMVKIGGEKFVDPLLRVLDLEEIEIPGTGELLGLKIIRALGSIGSEKAVEPLLNLFERKNQTNGYGSVASALGCIGDKRAVEPLIEALSDESCKCKGDVVKALGLLNDKRAVEPLIGALDDEMWYVRSVAVKSLTSIGGSKVKAALVDYDYRDIKYGGSYKPSS